MDDYRQLPPAPNRITGGSRVNGYIGEQPLFSILTIVRNGASTIERCIESVINQTYPNIEFIVGDGASTDGTLDFLRRYDSAITYWHSERDKKPEDAFNKMVPHAHGKYVGVLLADDWLEPDFVTQSVRALNERDADYVFGEVDLYEEGKFLYRRRGRSDFTRTIRYEVSFNTPSWSLKREIFNTVGLFKLVNVSPEYDLMLRAHLAGFKGAYDPAIVYNFSFGGNSSEHSFLGYREVREMAIANGGNVGLAWYYYLRRSLRHRLRQILERFLPEDLMLGIRRWRRRIIQGRK